MLSFTGRRNLFGTLSNNTASATLTMADQLINIEEKRILSSRQWSFMEKQFFMTTGDTFTVTIASPGVFTVTTYNYAVNDIVYFTTTGVLPTGLTASTPYYVVSISGNTFQVSATQGGTAINTSGSQSGTHSIVPRFKMMPQYVDRISSLYVTVGSYNYVPRECPDRATFDRLNLVTVQSDIPIWWFNFDGKLGFYPRPTTATNLITINSKRLQKDLSVADYTTGTITTTSGNTITGSGTTWTAQMAGRWLQITDGNGAVGDGYWYQILSIASTTSLTLVKPYAGTALSAASANYTIAQVSQLPEQYQDLPIYGALRTYYTSVDPNPEKAQLYGGMYQVMYKTMEDDYTVKNVSCVISDGDANYQPENPNLFITLT